MFGVFGKRGNYRGQATIFIIVALIIVVGIVVVFLARGNFFTGGVSAEFAPVYNLYGECIEDEVRASLSILGAQGGEINLENFETGSDHAPFSSHLNFLGTRIPYWYRVSGNNIIETNAPSRQEMQEDVSEFIQNRLNSNCDFSEHTQQGFFIDLPDAENVKVSAEIGQDNVKVVVDSELIVSKEDRSAVKGQHEINVESNIGLFYETAREIYNKEVDEAFLEEYAVDTLRLNAPVDGVDVQCSPRIWSTGEVVDDLRESLSANIGAVKFSGDYYDLDEEDRYFVVDVDVPDNAFVNLLYSEDWPSKVEITPAQQDLMIAEPVGNQEGLGVVGFCYVPYHFVYDVSFPVLIQISDGLEVFQFPVTVIVDNNVAREAELTGLSDAENVDVCRFRQSEIEVYTYDDNLNPVEADVSYKCFDSVCGLGSTEIQGSDAFLIADAPTCANGQIIVRAEGFEEKVQRFSTNTENSVDIILDRLYEVDVSLFVNAKEVSDSNVAVINFRGQDNSVSAVLPENNVIKLKEGLYDVSASVYGSSSVAIPASSRTECVDTPSKGLLGFFGTQEEECFNIEIPPITLDQALIGGGESQVFVLESQLQEGSLRIDAEALQVPNSLEQLQYNYESFDSLNLEFNFGA